MRGIAPRVAAKRRALALLHCVVWTGRASSRSLSPAPSWRWVAAVFPGPESIRFAQLEQSGRSSQRCWHLLRLARAMPDWRTSGCIGRSTFYQKRSGMAAQSGLSRGCRGGSGLSPGQVAWALDRCGSAIGPARALSRSGRREGELGPLRTAGGDPQFARGAAPVATESGALPSPAAPLRHAPHPAPQNQQSVRRRLPGAPRIPATEHRSTAAILPGGMCRRTQVCWRIGWSRRDHGGITGL